MKTKTKRYRKIFSMFVTKVFKLTTRALCFHLTKVFHYIDPVSGEWNGNTLDIITEFENIEVKMNISDYFDIDRVAQGSTTDPKKQYLSKLLNNLSKAEYKCRKDQTLLVFKQTYS